MPDETTPHFLDAFYGVPLRSLLGWAREPSLAPSPEIREALRNPEVIDALREIAAREREIEHSCPKVIA